MLISIGLPGLRTAAALCLVTIAAGGAASGGEAPVSNADRTAIRAAITAQLDAFRRDDAAAAYRLASSHIEAKFGSPAQFLAMVAAAYPAIYRSREADFGPTVRAGGVTIQQVGIVGPDGGRDTAFYTVERESGGWRIDGCVLTADAGQSI